MALGAGLVLLAVGVGVIIDLFGKTPSAEHTFGSAKHTVTFLDAGETKVLFLANDPGVDHVECSAAGGPGARVDVKRFAGSLTLGQWHASHTVTATDEGDYILSCTGAESDRFGVGGDVTAGAFIAGVFAVLTGVGVAVLGAVVLVVVAVRRSRRVAR